MQFALPSKIGFQIPPDFKFELFEEHRLTVLEWGGVDYIGNPLKLTSSDYV